MSATLTWLLLLRCHRAVGRLPRPNRLGINCACDGRDATLRSRHGVQSGRPARFACCAPKLQAQLAVSCSAPPSWLSCAACILHRPGFPLPVPHSSPAAGEAGTGASVAPASVTTPSCCSERPRLGPSSCCCWGRAAAATASSAASSATSSAGRARQGALLHAMGVLLTGGADQCELSGGLEEGRAEGEALHSAACAACPFATGIAAVSVQQASCHQTFRFQAAWQDQSAQQHAWLT